MPSPPSSSPSPAPSRLDLELSLLREIYPELSLDAHARELKYTQDGASLSLRLPDDYPGRTLLVVIAASDARKVDLRDAMSARVRGFPAGEEVLDAVIAAFQELLAEVEAVSSDQPGQCEDPRAEPASYLTVVIWLHHLLATSKRKLATAPPAGVAGVTKPGYPGVMVFSGLRAAVTDHVDALKAENWQAFQVRLEVDERWQFAHGEGVVEVETMGEVAKDVGSKADVFLQAMKIK